jgi:hypothetical protein
MKRHAAAFLLVLGAALLFQAWFLGLTPSGIEIGDARLSSPYTEALAHGQSYLLDKPDPQHPLLDTSIFHGRHYIYFGIVPFAVFMVPAYLVTGCAPSPEAAIFLFCAVGYLAYGATLLVAIRRLYPKVPILISGAAFLVLIIGSGTWPLMGRPAIYEIENAAAYTFLALALLSLGVSEIRQARRLPWLMASSAFAGLTIGCRPNYIAAAGVIAFLVLCRACAGTGPPIPRAARALAPLLLVCLALASWNYHRFGDPFDFGLKHTVSEDPALVRPLLNLRNFPYGAHRYVLGAPRLIRYFPFIQGQREGPFALAPRQELSNQVYGFVLISPVLLFAALLLRRSAAAALRGAGALTGAALACFLGNFLFLACTTISCYRYPADFLGPLSLLAAYAILGLWDLRLGWIRRTLAVFLAPAVAWSACALIFQVFSTAQTTDLFDQRRPADFAAAARPFNKAVYLYERLINDGPRALALNIQLPINRFGAVEPLVVDGDPEAQDFLYLYYIAPGLLQIGFESTGRGGVKSTQLKVDYGKPHRIELRYGSFLPPDDHPLLSHLAPADVALARRMLTVLLDGIPVLDAQADFHLPRGNVLVGRSPDDAAFGARFTGRVLGVDRPLLPAKASPARWDSSAYGPLLMTAELVPMPPGVFDPLVSLGLPGQGAQLLLEHIDGDHVRFLWLDTGGRRDPGPPVAWPAHEPRKVEVWAGGLLPPIESSLWPRGTSQEERARAKRGVRVELEGREVLRADLTTLDVSPTMVAQGRDTLFLTGGVMPSASATIIAAGRGPW